MKGLLHTVGFLWTCFLTRVVSDEVLPPENVRLGWNDSLYQELSWTPPKHSMQDCKYQINSTIIIAGEESPAWSTPNSSYWMEYRVLNGGFLRISIQTVCSGRMSEAVLVGLDDPDLHLSCIIRSSTRTHCSWKPPLSAQLNFFYNLYNDTANDFDELRECPHYNSVRTGCDLKVDPDQTINVLLNGTLSNRTIRNVYKFDFLNLRLPPLNWTVKESEEQFLIKWTPPEFQNWRYIITYTACNNTSSHETTELFYKLNRVAECPYRISMRGVTGSGETEWTPDKHYGAVPVVNPVLFAVILIPLVLAVLVLLTLLWCMKNKDKIFPKVPQPNSELFKDLMNNNNKMDVPNFYFPKVEEECPVTLVLVPTNQPQL